MENKIYLNSKAKGTWGYEVTEKKMKIGYQIVPGFNEIPEAHKEILEKDPGYNAKIKKGTYKVLNGKQASIAESGVKKEDQKVMDKAKKVEEAKELYKGKISEMKETLKQELKTEREKFNRDIQIAVDARGEALKKVKVLEDGKVKILGEHAGANSGLKQELVISQEKVKDLTAEVEKGTKSFDSEKKVLEKEIDSLKTGHDKAVDSLKAENKKVVDGLNSKVTGLETTIKKLKKGE